MKLVLAYSSLRLSIESFFLFTCTVLCSSLLLAEPFVKQFALCYRTVVLPVCLSVLSVTMVYCGQMVGWIKMKLGMVVGLGPGHIVLDRDIAPPKRRTVSPPIFGPCLLWPNGRPFQLLLSSYSVMKLWTSDSENKPWLAFFDVSAAKYVLTRSICYCTGTDRLAQVSMTLSDLEGHCS